MRTTLDIDDDVLQAAKERAHREKKTTGEVISDLARSALTTPQGGTTPESTALFGFRPFPPRGGIVTNAQIDNLRQDDVY
jgi:hypothetical protein